MVRDAISLGPADGCLNSSEALLMAQVKLKYDSVIVSCNHITVCCQSCVLYLEK